MFQSTRKKDVFFRKMFFLSLVLCPVINLASEFYVIRSHFCVYRSRNLLSLIYGNSQRDVVGFIVLKGFFSALKIEIVKFIRIFIL